MIRGSKEVYPPRSGGSTRGGAATVVDYTSSIRYTFLNINLCTQVSRHEAGAPLGEVYFYVTGGLHVRTLILLAQIGGVYF